jgi:hypothetical protein
LEFIANNAKNVENVSSTDLKNIFAKKGLHAFDIKKNDFSGENKNKENFKICIRKNNAYDENKLNKVIKEEAERNGFTIKFVEDKNYNKKKYIFYI